MNHKYLNNLLVGKSAEIYWKLDSVFENIAIKEFNAMKARIPSIMPAEALEELGYFDNFKSHLTKCIPHIKLPANNNEKLTSNNEGYYLSPAGCLPIYPEISKYSENVPFCITALMSAFRYESGVWGRTRSWEFHCREMIFIGDRSYITNSFNTVRSIINEFAQKNNIITEVKNADDSFICDKENNRRSKILKKMQQNMGLKNEISWKDPIGNDVAIASFNFHNHHFSKKYSWDNNGKIVSGCIGFGLERWLCAWLESNPQSIEVSV